MAADLATVAFHSLSAEARICSSVCVCVCACGCEWVSVCAQWTVCKYVHLVYMRVSPPANPLVLLSLCVVSVSLCQQLVQLLLRLAAHQPTSPAANLSSYHASFHLTPPPPLPTLPPRQTPFGAYPPVVILSVRWMFLCWFCAYFKCLLCMLFFVRCSLP